MRVGMTLPVMEPDLWAEGADEVQLIPTGSDVTHQVEQVAELLR
jgi:hypothetical protein